MIELQAHTTSITKYLNIEYERIAPKENCDLYVRIKTYSNWVVEPGVWQTI